MNKRVEREKEKGTGIKWGNDRDEDDAKKGTRYRRGLGQMSESGVI